MAIDVSQKELRLIRSIVRTSDSSRASNSSFNSTLGSTYDAFNVSISTLIAVP